MHKFDSIIGFIAVIEENGFVAAARKLKISTPALSRQIAKLEASLGVQLLIRTTRRITATEIGLQYYQTCKKALEGLNTAVLEIAESQQEAQGTLSILAVPYFCKEIIIPRLSEFMKQNPKLTINMDVAERFPDLRKEEIDVVFGVSLPAPPEYKQKKISTTRYVLCASPDYLKKFGVPKIPKDLVNHHYVTHIMRVPQNIVRMKNGNHIYVDYKLCVNDTYAMREAAISGLGMIRIHDYMVNDDLKEGRLVEILNDHHDTVKIPVFLYYQQTKYMLPKIRRFIDFFSPSKE